MQIVIDIPKSAYEKIVKTMRHENSNNPAFYFESIISQGTVLPEHGRLKDVDWIDDNCRNYYTDDDGSWCYKWKDIEDAPTILEATGVEE